MAIQTGSGAGLQHLIVVLQHVNAFLNDVLGSCVCHSMGKLRLWVWVGKSHRMSQDIGQDMGCI